MNTLGHNGDGEQRGLVGNLSRYVALALYYSLGRYLPNRPFQLGRRFRRMLCKRIFRKCGRNLNIEKGAYFGTGRNIEIGDNSGIGFKAFIAGVDSKGELLIGNDVMMAPEVAILTMSHTHNTRSTPMRCQGEDGGRVVIRNDVWIGMRAIILPGVQIETGAIIGAGAVVTENVQPFAVVGGVPARKIGERPN